MFSDRIWINQHEERQHFRAGQSGRRRFYLLSKKWIEATSAIGLHAKAGRYGDTYARRDIVFKFCFWLSPEFKFQKETLI